MALEEDLMTELQAECPQVHVSTAPYDTPMPYVTWQHIGGDPLRYTDNTAANKRRPLIQINTWADTPLEAFRLIQRIEERLCAAAAFEAKPLGDPVGAYDDADIASGYLQTYTILGNR